LITSPDNPKLKQIRKLRSHRERQRTGLFVAEGEDLVAAAEAAGSEPELVLVAGEDVQAELLGAVSTLGSGTRVIGVYRQRWSRPGGRLSIYLHEVGDPGNVGAVIRGAHALCDGPVVLGPGCADPFSPKAVRASMGSVFARPPARADLAGLDGWKLALSAEARTPLDRIQLERPLVVCLGAERRGLPAELVAAVDAEAAIPMRAGGPDSLNVAMAATVALYELGRRMRGHA
jgi:TrmH family RNA methyltransferase